MSEVPLYVLWGTVQTQRRKRLLCSTRHLSLDVFFRLSLRVDLCYFVTLSQSSLFSFRENYTSVTEIGRVSGCSRAQGST